VVLRNTRKEKDKEKDKDKEREKDRDKDRDRDRDRDRERDRDRDNHDKPTSSLLSLDAFRLNWTGSNDESVTAGPAGTCVCVLTLYV
jgi:Ni/Co efflux regulator RcnB